MSLSNLNNVGCLTTLFGDEVRPDATPADGEIFLALDIEAVAALEEAGVDYTVLDDWLDADARSRVIQRAEGLEDEWRGMNQGLLSYDGTVWPDYDHLALRYFWLEFATAVEYSTAFRSARVPAIRCSFRIPSRGSTYVEEHPKYGSSFVFSWTMRHQFRGRVMPSSLPEVRNARRWQAGDVRRDVAGRVAALACARPNAIRNKLAIVLTWNEADRLEPLILRLAQAFPSRVCAILYAADPILAFRLQRRWGIPVVHFNSKVRADSHLRDELLKQMDRRLQSIAFGRESAAGFMLRAWASERWSQLVGLKEKWTNLLVTHPPAYLLASTVDTAEGKLPVSTASKLRIPTVSVPHGAVEWLYPVEDVERVLYAFELQGVLYEHAGTSSKVLSPCSDALLEREYGFRRLTESPMATDRFNILVLTEQFGFPGLVSTRVGPSLHREAIRMLSSPPEPMDEVVSTWFRSHPNRMEESLLEALVAPPGKLVPRDADLQSVLGSADVVVALNYCGSALAHAIRSVRPIILFWNDPVFGQSFATKQAPYFRDAGSVITDGEDFWPLIRTLRTDSEVRIQQREVARAFSESRLSNDSYPSLTSYFF